MSQIIENTAGHLVMDNTPGIAKRTAVLFYGVFAYNVGVAGLLWLILALGGLVPVGFSPLHTGTVVSSLLVNLVLISLFGMQHSVMARDKFKKWLTRYVPEAAERSTFMLMSGIVTLLAIYFWQPLPGTVWSVENMAGKTALWAMYALGWAYLFTSTFVTNHFELMGLRQVYLYFNNKPYTSLPFTRKYMYRYSRHPMMLGVLLGMWAIPEMSLSHFVMSVLLTLYMVVGVVLEERDLVTRFGDTYRKYRKEVATFIPNLY